VGHVVPTRRTHCDTCPFLWMHVRVSPISGHNVSRYVKHKWCGKDASNDKKTLNHVYPLPFIHLFIVVFLQRICRKDKIVFWLDLCEIGASKVCIFFSCSVSFSNNNICLHSYRRSWLNLQGLLLKVKEIKESPCWCFFPSCNSIHYY